MSGMHPAMLHGRIAREIDANDGELSLEVLDYGLDNVEEVIGELREGNEGLPERDRIPEAYLMAAQRCVDTRRLELMGGPLSFPGPACA